MYALLFLTSVVSLYSTHCMSFSSLELSLLLILYDVDIASNSSTLPSSLVLLLLLLQSNRDSNDANLGNAAAALHFLSNNNMQATVTDIQVHDSTFNLLDKLAAQLSI